MPVQIKTRSATMVSVLCGTTGLVSFLLQTRIYHARNTRYCPNKDGGIGNKLQAIASKRQALIDGLNQDLAGEYQAILMYTHYSAKLTGPYRLELRSLFLAEVDDEQGHAQFLSDKIAAMGGEPTTEPRSVSHVHHPRQMLEQALKAEVQAIADYTLRIGQAEECRELGLKVQLENQLADETRHKEELERIIAGWIEVSPERSHSDEHWNVDRGPR